MTETKQIPKKLLKIFDVRGYHITDAQTSEDPGQMVFLPKDLCEQLGVRMDAMVYEVREMANGVFGLTVNESLDNVMRKSA